MYFLSQLFNGLQSGAIYALIALGYTMVYGIIKLINFAHGDLMIAGAYCLLFCLQAGIPFWAALLITLAASALLNVLIEKIAYKPLRNASRLSALITAIAVSLFLQSSFALAFTSTPRRFPISTDDFPFISLGSLKLNVFVLGSIGVAVVLMILLQLFVHRTRLGKAMLAVSEDMDAARLMGINVSNTISLTFAIGAVLAAVAATLYVISYPQIHPFMGALPGIKAFVAAVLGGIGQIPGAMLGGFILGVVEVLTKAYIPSAYSQLSDAVVFAILIVVLVVKPSGLVGKVQREKV